jgi:hypothetical protein
MAHLVQDIFALLPPNRWMFLLHQLQLWLKVLVFPLPSLLDGLVAFTPVGFELPAPLANPSPAYFLHRF